MESTQKEDGTTMQNPRLYSAVDYGLWSNIRSGRGSVTVFPETPVPARSDSAGLQMDKIWHKIITDCHIWNTATHGK